MITMIERQYPHVDELVKKQKKTTGDRVRLSVYGVRGNKSPRRPRKVALRELPLFPKLNLDPKWEFPLHEVLYRGKHFLLLEAKKCPSKVAVRRAALLDWVSDPSNYAEECRRRNEQANLHICPID